MMLSVGIERCPCGDSGCRDYHLTGIGKFCQGSGFTYEEAMDIRLALVKTFPDKYCYRISSADRERKK